MNIRGEGEGSKIFFSRIPRPFGCWSENPLEAIFQAFLCPIFLGICEERGHFSLVEGRHVEAFTGKARKSAFIFTKAFQGDERMSAYLEDQKKEKKGEITTFLGKSKEFLWPVSLLRNFLH